MKIGLLDADLMDNGTRHPNLALMKLAGYYRSQGHTVELIFDSYQSVYQFDRVFLSKVFTFSRVPEWVLALKHVTIGGTGFFEDGGPGLPDEIEHHMPDYSLYQAYVERQLALGHRRARYADYLDYSIGFATRGCFRKCAFCVNQKYDHAFRHSPIREFFDERRPFLYLWDDNILAFPGWEEVLDELEATGRPFQFRQGIDLRLMTDRKAKRLVSARYQGDFIFAFDHLEDREQIIQKVQIWKRYSAKVCKMYVIAAYQSQDAADIADVLERIHILMQYGSLPYIMRYEAYKTSRWKHIYIELARWCNQPNFFKKMSFREFCAANQRYKKDQSSNCSAYQALLDFEAAYPALAKQYFDLRFEQENLYSMQYGYGRRYANKPLCAACKERGLCWDAFLCGQEPPRAMLQAYFTKEIDLECLRYGNAECRCTSWEAAAFLAGRLAGAALEELAALLRGCAGREEVDRTNLPPCDGVEDGLFGVVQLLRASGGPMCFDAIGAALARNRSAPGQDLKKYGEKYAKLAALLDLVRIRTAGGRALVSLSEFGRYVSALASEEQEALVCRLCLRIPIVQNYFLSDCPMDTLDRDLNAAAQGTRARRRAEALHVIQWMNEHSGASR